ncbi:MAG: hypothetical protein H7837_07060 [Magnetococcus sp. MYC-9]
MRPVAEQSTGRALLAQQIRIDRPDLKMSGEIVLRSLQPLAGELRLQQARGEPRHIFAGVMRLVPGVTGVMDGFFDVLEIHDLDLAGLVITVNREGYALQLASATIPEGELQQVTGRFNSNRVWQLASGGLRLAQVPLRLKKGLPAMPLSYRTLQANGSGQERLSLEVEKVRVGHLAALADPSGVLGQLLRAMGFARGLESSPIVFDRLAVTAVSDAQRVVTQSLLLQAPKASATGVASMAWQPEPRKVHLEVDVTTAKQPARHFDALIPLVAGR